MPPEFEVLEKVNCFFVIRHFSWLYIGVNIQKIIPTPRLPENMATKGCVVNNNNNKQTMEHESDGDTNCSY